MQRQADAVTWRTLLSACRVHRNVDLAIYAAKQIQKLDRKDSGTYILLSYIYANSHRWDDVADVRRTMRLRGVRKEPGCSCIEVNTQIHAFLMGDNSHPHMEEINKHLRHLIQRLMEVGYIPDINFLFQDLEGEQREESLQYHCEKLAIVFGTMRLPKEKIIRTRKNIRICGESHVFAKLAAKMEEWIFMIRDIVRYHHFQNGACSCGDYW